MGKRHEYAEIAREHFPCCCVDLRFRVSLVRIDPFSLSSDTIAVTRLSGDVYINIWITIPVHRGRHCARLDVGNKISCKEECHYIHSACRRSMLTEHARAKIMFFGMKSLIAHFFSAAPMVPHRLHTLAGTPTATISCASFFCWRTLERLDGSAERTVLCGGTQPPKRYRT